MRMSFIRVSERSIPSSLLLALVVANSAHGVQDNRLWLLRTQQALRPQLVQAAQLAENTEGCEEVISGELDTERSMDSEPVFRIVCRNPAGYTYSVFVTDAGKPGARVEKVQTADNLNTRSASPSGKSVRPATINEKTARQKCLAALKLRTDRMADVILRDSDLRRLQSPAGAVHYELDFDASDPSGLALRFQATCRVSAGGTALIEIKPRRAEVVAPPRKLDAPATQRDGGDTNSILTDEALTDKTRNADASIPALESESEKVQKPVPAVPVPAAPKQTDDDGWEVVE